MAELKNSQQMLRFLEDLSKFTQTFSTFEKEPEQAKAEEKQPAGEKAKKENPQSPVSGIADGFIENLLKDYLRKKD